MFVCKVACVYAHTRMFSLFAAVCVAWPEGAHCNGHPTGRKTENDETVGRVAG